MKKVLEGNHAVSYGAKAANVQVIAAYPITPQTQIVEKLSEMCASGELNAKFIKVESEHSAMAAVVGSSGAGARSFTATSSQGLLLMHEMLHWAVGARLPIVLANVNRSVGPPWNIWTDQNDSLSQRDTGMLQFYCESNQEVHDTVLHAFRVSEEVMLPSMVILDAFFLSHTCEIVDVVSPEDGARYLPPYRPDLYLNPALPHAFGNLTGPDNYFELRYKIYEANVRALDVVRKAHEEFERMFGRAYGAVERYHSDGADMVLVTSGTLTSTARYTVDMMRDKGRSIGLVKMRLFRPFPIEEVRAALAGAKKIVVIDRNIGFSIGGIFTQEIRAALWNTGARTPVFGFIAGIGGRDVTPETIAEIVERADALDEPGEEAYWIGVKDERLHSARR
ncbi:MAG: pyruvate ferredoxin oxidoreductase [Chitinivibrionia bacterium]|nr:pyruvate ferredoxin oxidoreductase [Chitinivibrionia bacterium]